MGWGEDPGRRARSRGKWRRVGPASHRGLPSSAVSAGLPGLAGLRVTSDADSQDERGWSWGRKANGDGGARLPNPGQRRQTVSFVIPPPGGEGFYARLGSGRGGAGGSGVPSALVSRAAR